MTSNHHADAEAGRSLDHDDRDEPRPKVTVDITLTLTLDTPELTPAVRAALESLADVMGVQAEDGLYTGGSPDAATDDNEFVCDVDSWQIRPVVEVSA